MKSSERLTTSPAQQKFFAVEDLSESRTRDELRRHKKFLLRGGGQKGYILLEALVAAAIALVIIGVGVGAFALSVQSASQNAASVQAVFLEEEGLEAARIMRDSSWSGNITPHASSTIYIGWSGSTWQATTSNAYVNSEFSRTLTFGSVYRNGSEDIVPTGGTLDPNTVKVTVSVAWKQNGATTTKMLSAYLTNLFNN